MTKLLFLLTIAFFDSHSFADTKSYCVDSLRASRQIEYPTTLQVVKAPAANLSQRSRSVSQEQLRDHSFQKFVSQLIELRQQRGSLGLAAPQVGVNLRVAVVLPKKFAFMPWPRPQKSELILINPTITPLSKETRIGLEGCASIDAACHLVARFKSIKVNFLDLQGKPQERIFSDFTAVIIQHEVDHLDGILFNEIKQRDIEKFNLTAANTIDTSQRKKLLQLFNSLSVSQLENNKTYTAKVNRDLFLIDEAGSPLHTLKTHYEQTGSEHFYDDLMAYYRLRLESNPNLQAYNHWIKSEYHALFVLEDLYLGVDPTSKSLLSDLRGLSPFLKSLKLNGIRGPPFEDLRRIQVPVHTNSRGYDFTAPSAAEALAFSKAISDYSIIWDKGAFVLRVRNGKQIKIVRAPSIPAVNQIVRSLQKKDSSTEPSTENTSSNELRQQATENDPAKELKQTKNKPFLLGVPSLPISFGIEAEYANSLTSPILHDYRFSKMSDQEWVKLADQERMELAFKEIKKNKKQAQFLKIDSAPEWLPPVVYGENDGNFEFNGMIYNSLDDAKGFLQQLEQRYGKGFYQGHVVSYNGTPIKGLAGYLLFESDLAQLQTLEVNFQRAQKDSNFEVGKNLVHHSLGPLGEADRKTLIKAENNLVANAEIEIGKTSKTLAPIVRTNIYPEGRVGIEFRQYGTRAKDLLQAMEEVTQELTSRGHLSAFDVFKNVPSISIKYSLKLIQAKYPSITEKQFKRFFKQLSAVTIGMTKAISSSGSTGGQLEPGYRFLFPLREWEKHPVLSELSEQKRHNIKSQVESARDHFIDQLAALIQDRRLKPEETSRLMRKLVVDWSQQVNLSQWFTNYKQEHLNRPMEQSVAELLLENASAPYLVQELPEWPALPFEEKGSHQNEFTKVYSVKSVESYAANEAYRAFLFNSVEAIYFNMGESGHFQLRIGDRYFAFNGPEVAVRDTFETLNLKPGRLGFAFYVPYSKIVEVLPKIDQFYNNAIMYNLIGFDIASAPMLVGEHQSDGLYDGFKLKNSTFVLPEIQKATGYLVRDRDQLFIETPDGSRIEATETERGICVSTRACASSATYVLEHFFDIPFSEIMGAKRLRKALLRGTTERVPDAILDYSP